MTQLLTPTVPFLFRFLSLSFSNLAFCLMHSAYERLCCTARSTPRIYGLPKIHKPDVPFRPIVSFYSSPIYQLSKHLSIILSPLVGKTTSFVKNSAEFARFIRQRTVQKDEVMVSFDVVSLFTKIPVDLAVSVAHSRLMDDPTLEDQTLLSPDEISSLLSFCLNATYFTFRGTFFEQVSGTAMGSLISVVKTNLVMKDVEQKALSSLRSRLPLWKRYVDDMSFVAMSICAPNSDLYRLQYTCTKLYQRMIDVCLWLWLSSQISHATLNHTTPLLLLLAREIKTENLKRSFVAH